MSTKSALLQPLPSPRANKEVLALAFLVVMAVAAVLGVPAASWREAPFDPCHVATIAGVISVVGFVVTRRLGDRALGLERLLAALFLGAMPFVYVGSYLTSRAPSGPEWQWIELAAVPLYVVPAIVGFRKHPELLALGIALHGMGWDLWHYGTSTYVPSWYAAGCLELDVALAAYVFTRLPRWKKAALVRQPSP
jgi:hypothetical protein